jgi:hypothetical protein
MSNIKMLLKEVDDLNIARKVSNEHDKARVKFPLSSNTVKDFDEYCRIIGDYVRYHNSVCISEGGYMSQAEAVGLGREIIEQEYRRKGSDFIGAYNDARDGVNGGLRAILDVITEGLKAISVERFIRHTFDRYVAPNSWDQKVAIIREFINHCGTHLSYSIQADKPERYAASYYELIRNYVESMRRTSSVFRRL